MPTTPQDDLLENYNGDKDYFFESIESFIDDATKAIEQESNQLKASKLWQKHLGTYFPDGQDIDVDKQANALAGIASTILDGKANSIVQVRFKQMRELVINHIKILEGNEVFQKATY